VQDYILLRTGEIEHDGRYREKSTLKERGEVGKKEMSEKKNAGKPGFMEHLKQLQETKGREKSKDQDSGKQSKKVFRMSVKRRGGKTGKKGGEREKRGDK